MFFVTMVGMFHRWLVSTALLIGVAGCSSEASTVFGATDGSSGPPITGAGGFAGTGGEGGVVTSGGGGTNSVGGNGGAGGIGGAGAGGNGGVGGNGGGSSGDLDKDGLDDAWEMDTARDYLPFLSLDPGDGCTRGGMLVRVHPHPSKGSLIHIVYDHLYEKDCGLTGHVGDNEAFGVTIDPTIPPPAGILTMVAIGHQSTICEKKTTCGSCGGLNACATAMKNGAPYPVVFSSKDKHASYVEKDQCNPFLSCFDTCTLASMTTAVALVNVGEPSAPLVTDLTDQGFITSANGWTAQELFHWNPWDGSKDFGGAGNVAEDLVDTAFIPPVCP